MNSRRLGFVAVRTAVFVAAALAVAIVNGWPTPATVAVALTTAALAVQLIGMLWLRRHEQAPATPDPGHRHS